MAELSCVGVPGFEVTYTYTEPDRVGVSGVGQVYCPLNGGTLTANWIENLQFRRYFDVGYFSGGDTRDCGFVYGFICGYYSYFVLADDYIFENNRWYKSYGEIRRYLRVTSKEDVDFFATVENQDSFEYFDFVDKNIVSSSAGDLGASLALYKVAGCTRDYPSSSAAAALNYTKVGTFRGVYPASKWYLSIKEDGQEIYQYGSPDSGFNGSGTPPWHEPSDVNRRVIYQPSTSIQRSFSFTKTQRETGIKLFLEPWSATRYSSSDQRIYIGGQRSRMVFQEIGEQEEIIRTFPTDVLSGGVGIPSDLEISCLGICPPETCAVDCGTYICCYGSDGVAVSSYEK